MPTVTGVVGNSTTGIVLIVTEKMLRNNNGKRRPQYGVAQTAFIRRIWEEVSLDTNYFVGKDWRNIAPKGGRYSLPKSNKQQHTYSYYVKPLAVFIPHLLIKDHVPKCPDCEKSAHVNVNSTRWVTSPKVLFGMSSHRYLDTILYKCRSCNREFAGYNEKSMRLDGDLFIGLFQFQLYRTYAVDDELYHWIVANSTLPTATIAKSIAACVTNRYLDDAQFYYNAVINGKVKATASKYISPSDARQRTLHAGVAPVRQLTRAGAARKKANTRRASVFTA